ncbi:septal ring lytic transglycosylase RlpA family protein [Alphaproteobacteria bacterium]|nr:septal ring lytic transglycosylase RlpA family protein [Alphaproteobacteria bacterium]
MLLLTFLSCSVTNNSEKKTLDKTINDEGGYFKKKNIQISPLDSYEIDFKVSEKYYESNELYGMSISHKLLPIPSVVKVANPNNLKSYLIVRNSYSDENKRLLVSSEIVELLDVNSNIYIEFLKEESLILRKVDESKELSKVKLDSTTISFETLEGDQDGLSSELNYEKIEEIELKKKKYEGLILIDKYDNLTSAKLKTNKIKNLGLFFEDIDDQIAVFSGPFKNNDINLKLDFLLRNGYQNAQTYP